MKVDIWSDVMCPFCYIGKRKFETALAQFSNKDNIEVVWHSFQLDPDMEYQPGKDLYSYLAERKGQSLDWSKQMHKQVAGMAAEVGLEYNFDKAVINNSFDAHRFVQLAKKHGLGDAAEESLFKGYFTEGKNIGDHDTLVKMGEDIGLNGAEVAEALKSDAFVNEVDTDIYRAQQIGVSGVPFFVINDKYAVSGAQQPATFLQALDHAWGEYAKETPVLTNLGTADGAVCEPGGDC